ncbi:MAG: lipase maturation factor family protein [Verrucomicrobia bacterium]|nr:lipase maturation factor family protein [Verrucomicrobiota bacterium]MCH8526797.1 lipase maturation factor family protein [Kiritimatiellia bacterium]
MRAPIQAVQTRLRGFRMPESGLSIHLALRILGGIFFFNFWSIASQANGLWSDRGLTPSVLWPWVLPIVLGGAAAALVLIAGRLPWWALLTAWGAQVFLLHLDGPWLQFQGDVLLAEVGFLALFLASPGWRKLPPPSRIGSRPTGLILMNGLLIKVMLGSGWMKLTGGDPFWLRETALNVFFETQPLPAATAWFFHHLPGTVLKHALWYAVMIEVMLPLYVFLPRLFRSIAAGGFTLLMLLVIASGHHGWMPWLVILLSLLLIDDRTWRQWLPEGRGPAASVPLVAKPLSLPGLALLLIWIPLTAGLTFGHKAEVFWPPWRQAGEGLAHLRAGNRYAMYGRVQPRRFEVEIQGSLDGEHWREYLFKVKPGHPQRLSMFPDVHTHRLDQQFHQVALHHANPRAWEAHPWLGRLAGGLLENDPVVTGLLDVNPFPDQPPRYLRLVTYQVRFADPVTRRERGIWWMRSVRGLYGPVIRRED